MSVKWVGCLLTLLLILTGLDSARAEISNLRKCADPKCKEPISKGRTMIGYPSNDEQILSFPINAEVTVYSKEAGSRLDLWGVEIKGKRGYVPKQYIREHKVFVSKLEFEVPTEGASDNEDSAKDETESNAEPILTEILAEEIALSAEDVEYKRLQEAPLAKEESDPLEEDVQVSSESDGENENGDQGDLETKKPLHDKSAEVDVNEEEEKGNDGGDEEEEKVPDEMENQRDSTDNEKLENNDEKSKGTGSETLSPDENEGDNLEPQPSVVQEGEVDEDTKGEHTHTDHEASAKPEDPVSTTDVPVDEEVLPVDYEVIDGTTLYFDDTTPLPPTAEVVSPVNLMSSSAMDEEYVTAHPSLKLSQEAHVEGSEGQIVDISVTSTVSLEMSTATLIESGSETAATEAVLEPTEVLAFEEVGATQTEETPIPLNPTPSLLSEATASVTSWFGNEYSEIDEKEKQGEQDEVNEDSKVARNSDEEEEEEVDELENENGFGSPKAESVIDGAEIMSEEKESEGFFSSWFSSSEPPKVEEVHDESADDSGTTKSDKAIHGEVEVESEIASDGSSAEAPKADPVDYITPPETIEFPVEPTESPELNVRPPHAAAADVDIAYNTQHSPLSSVDDFPETPVTSDLDQNPETPLDPEDKVSVDDPSVDSSTTSMNDQVDRTEEAGLSNAEIGDSAITSTEIRAQADNTAVSDVEDPHTSSPGDDEDLDTDTSTARPLYAEPEPASQEYHSHSHVDHDDLSHLAGEGAVMDGSESSEGESADMSLSEGLLKTSHNLWLALTGAVQLPEGLAFGFEAEIAEPQVSNGMLVFLLIVSGTVVTIYFVHLVMMAWQALLCKISREGPLLEALNRIDHENRVKADENESLHAELVKARAELESVASRVTMSSGDVNEISSQLEMVKNEYANEKIQLEERIVQLEHELEEATSNGLEMHKMLSEMLAAQKEASAFQASIDHLQSMLDGQREKVETLTSDLALKNRLNEELHNELSSSMERANKLDYQVEQLTHSLEELTGVKGEAIRKLQEEAALVEELKQANTSLTQQTGDYDSKVTSLSSELTDLRETISQLRESVETKESELQVAKECLKQLRLTSSDDSAAPDEEKLSALFDVIRVKAELHKVNNDRLNLVEQLQDAEMAQKNLEEAMASIRTEVTELRTHHDVAIREKQEAMSKLEVLTKYFEEKEAQLTKELESQEGLRVNAEGSAAAVAKKIQNYELELASYKTQVETLRKELEEQEASYKSQITIHEQKAHENWLQARSAERKNEEQRQENSQLRGRLTMLQKEKEEVQQSQVNIIKPTPKRVDANGTMSSPRPMVDGVDGDHSGPPSLHRDLDSPPIPPPHPMHGPPMLPMMFPPGGPLPPGVPPPHGLPPPPPGLPHGVPPPHGLPPHPFLPGEPPFMGPLPPLHGDRRLPPAGGMSSPPFRRSGSPSYDHRNDRYSPLSDRSHISDRRHSPPPLRRRPLSPEMHRNRSPDRRSDRTRSPDRRSDRIMRSPDHRNERRSPDRRSDRRSPDRHYTRSPDGYMRHRNSPRSYYDEPDYNNDDSRLRSHHIKGKKTSTPLGPNDR
ncbi:transport and Golgi organization protein 1-like isoform X18 [Macrobrachium rosenbergii]|uniref:transport and Golgi organization protein 1-like isoform X18 n=1 Tax=Macrobrachium rosenbergii TaxID=79674 RepID=UPI0034D4A8E1